MLQQRLEEWMVPVEKEKAPPRPVQAAAIAGFVGALLLFAIQLAMQTTGRGGAPLGMMFATGVLHLSSMTAMLIGTFLFCLAGAAWGALYAALVPRLTVATGLLFGLAPWLVSMLIMLPLVGKPVFAGGDAKAILVSLVLNVLWGGFVAALIPPLSKPRLTS
jgi:hypothetical protein